MNIVLILFQVKKKKSQRSMGRWNSALWCCSSVCGFQSQDTHRAPERKSMGQRGAGLLTHTHTCTCAQSTSHVQVRRKKKMEWISSSWACDPNSIQMFSSIRRCDHWNHCNCALMAASALCQQERLRCRLRHLLPIAELGSPSLPLVSLLSLPLFHGCGSFFPLSSAPFFMP